MGLFPGTENTPGIAAFSEAVSILEAELEKEQEVLSALSRDFLLLLEKSGIPYQLESPELRVPGVMCISFPWVDDMERFLYTLSEHQICVSRFSACSNNIDGPSRILLAMGRPMKRACASVRISLGRWSKREDIFRFIRAVQEYR